MEQILTLIAAVLGGCNLLQYVTLRQLKRKETASADLAELSVEKERNSLKREETGELMKELDAMRAKILQLNKETLQYLDDISDLKGKVRYFQSWTCFRASCEQRMRKSRGNEKDKGLFEAINRCE